MGARVYVKGVEQAFHVTESPAQVLDVARSCDLEGIPLPMATLTLARPIAGDTELEVDPWSIVAVTPWAEPGA